MFVSVKWSVEKQFINYKQYAYIMNIPLRQAGAWQATAPKLLQGLKDSLAL